MSELQNSSFGSRKKVWIGIGVVAAVAIVLASGIYPRSGTDTIGTALGNGNGTFQAR